LDQSVDWLKLLASGYSMRPSLEFYDFTQLVKDKSSQEQLELLRQHIMPPSSVELKWVENKPQLDCLVQLFPEQRIAILFRGLCAPALHRVMRRSTIFVNNLCSDFPEYSAIIRAVRDLLFLPFELSLLQQLSLPNKALLRKLCQQLAKCEESQGSPIGYYKHHKQQLQQIYKALEPGTLEELALSQMKPSFFADGTAAALLPKSLAPAAEGIASLSQ